MQNGSMYMVAAPTRTYMLDTLIDAGDFQERANSIANNAFLARDTLGLISMKSPKQWQDDSSLIRSLHRRKNEKMASVPAVRKFVSLLCLCVMRARPIMTSVEISNLARIEQMSKLNRLREKI